MKDTADSMPAASPDRRRAGVVAAAISACLLVAANLVTIYVLYLAVAISPDGSWDVGESTDNVQMLSTVAGILAAVVAALTAFVLATRWLRSRWWLTAPALMLLCSGARWLFPS